jgi:hypothetical protein
MNSTRDECCDEVDDRRGRAIDAPCLHYPSGMHTLTLLRELTLSNPTQPDRAAHLSAASGLVRVGDYLYVVADDENHLGVFSARDHAAPGQLLRALRGDLPEGLKKRKAAKADFESLAVLPSFAPYPHGALLALGSGSRENRMNAALISLDEHGVAHRDDGRPRIIDFAPLFQSLQREFEDVNIEGAFVSGDHLSLLQRGNKGNGRNTRIRIALAPLLACIASGRDSVDCAVVDIVDFSLGEINHVPFGFTDAAALPDGGFVFTAAAENTDNSYADGPCAGAMIGVVGADNRLGATWAIDRAIKPEGIAAQVNSDALELLIVTDADDANVPAQLFAATIRDWR